MSASSTPAPEGASLISASVLPHADAASSAGAFSNTASRNHRLRSSVSPRRLSSAMTSGNPTIGSFNGFPALLRLSSSLHKAFSEAAAASAEFADATTRLGTFHLAIGEICASLHKAEDVPICVQDGISSALASCTAALKRVDGRIDLQRRRIEALHGSRACEGFWASCAFVVLGGKSEISDLLQQLDDHVVALRTLLGLLHSTALHNIARRRDIIRADMARVVACVRSLDARVRSHAPIQFVDHKERAVDPLLKMAWGNFVDFWTEHDFPVDAAALAHGEIFKAQYAEPSPGGLVYFNLYIYADPQSFGTPTALISPLYFYLRSEDAPQRSYALSRLFLSSATWLAKTLDNPTPTRAPLIGPRSRQQFVHMETGFPDDIRGSLHTRQYFLDTAPGPTQPEGRLSEVFACLSEAQESLNEARRAAEMWNDSSCYWEVLDQDAQPLADRV